MKNILFDLYGTLIDIHTDEGDTRFWKRLAKKVRCVTNIDYISLRTEYLSICESYQKVKEEIDILDVFMKLFKVDRNIASKIALEFRKCSTKYLKLYKGVNELLVELKDKGYKLYLLSNAQESFTMYELEKLNLIKDFEDIFISSKYGVKKPNKEFYKIALEKYDMDVKDTVMIGNDYTCDIAPAKELGLKTIFIKSNLTPFEDKNEDLKGFNKDKIITMINSFTNFK